MGQLRPLLIVIGGALAAHDEAFHGTAADSYYELQVQTDRKAPLPDDRWRRGPRSGRRA
ncbi:hypothetical protein [Streptomyces canus]|uniref:hypothetical protein n=1 Tax=Streptomyces canus TaxID=58343 RepID=UPI00380257B1